MEEIDSFGSFLDDGIEHLTRRGPATRGALEAAAATADEVGEAAVGGGDVGRHPSGQRDTMVEKMKVVRTMFHALRETLRTGIADGALYSTAAEEHLDWASPSAATPESIGGEDIATSDLEM